MLLLFACGSEEGAGGAEADGADAPVFELGSFGPYSRDPVAVVGNLKVGDRAGFFENKTCSGRPVFQQAITAEWLRTRSGGSLVIPLSLNFHLQRDYAYSVMVIGSDGGRSECLSRTFTFDTTSVVAGTAHTCAILNNGLLKCWGAGADGRTGQGSAENRGDGDNENGIYMDALNPGAATEGGGRLAVVAVALGGRHSCALMTDDTLRCWGEGGSGQLGNGDTVDIGDGPGEIPHIEGVLLGEEPDAIRAVSLGNDHSCVLTGSLGRTGVKCWGKNRDGQLGLGDDSDRGGSERTLGENLPEVDVGGDGATPWRISAGGDHTCVVFTGGRIKCWGKNRAGQLGLEDDRNRGDGEGQMGTALPYVDLGKNGRVRDVAAGGSHTCVLFEDGRIKCWGKNDAGQLGLGDFRNRGDGGGEMGTALPFVDIGDGKAAKAISAGHGHTCAVLEGGALLCWGKNDKGQLGVGDSRHRNVPVALDLGDGVEVVSVSAGGEHTCALLGDDSMKCWGEGGVGQLLGGNPDDQNAPPDDPMDLDDNLVARDISMGPSHACALLNHGRVKCWGKNDVGQLGQGDTDGVGKTSSDPDDELDEIPPVDLGTDVTVRAVAVGSRHSCAMLDGGGVKCWGANDSGQLGLGTSVGSGDPT